MPECVSQLMSQNCEDMSVCGSNCIGGLIDVEVRVGIRVGVRVRVSGGEKGDTTFYNRMEHCSYYHSDLCHYCP